MAQSNGYDLPENTVEYRLYPRLPPKLPSSEINKFLLEQVDAYHAHLSKYLVSFIWQNEQFRLNPFNAESGKHSDIPHVFGRTNYGDNVDDEWFIVFLMYQLTLAFSGLIVKIGDTDGEILLIEAAHSLPRGLNPETAENRVFIACGKVHIVPEPMNDREAALLPPRGPITVQQSLQAVRTAPRLTVADRAVQNDVANRIHGYPSKIREGQHLTHAYIPAPLAAVLEHSPHLVSPIVQAFYHRDPIDLKCCVTMKHFRPGTRVMREVQMTRCLYAQLVQQQFTPDKRSGWNIPAANSPTYKSYDLGMKLAHGAEILCSQAFNSDISPAQDLTERSQHDTQWQRFLSTLRDKGYFKNELEGSKRYTTLLDDARKYYYSAVRPDSSSVYSYDKGGEVLRVLRSVQYDIETMRQQEKQLGLPDDDSWLEITPEQLDEMLAKAAGRKADNMDTFNMNTLADTMKDFIENTSSSVDGVEFPSYSSSRQGSEEPSDINFDVGGSMIQSMTKMFEFDEEDSDSSTDMSGYSSDEDLNYGRKQKNKPNTVAPPPKPAPRRSKQAHNGKNTAPTSGVGVVRGDMVGGDVGGYLGLDSYMKQMDKELSTTEVGKSFVKEEKKTTTTTRQYSHTTGNSSRLSGRPTSTMSVDIDDLDDDFTPVNVDMNLVQNMMQSMDTQPGAPGPASHIVTGMGVNVPHSRPNNK